MTMHTSCNTKSKKTFVSSDMLDFKIAKKKRSTGVNTRLNERITEEWVTPIRSLAMARALEVQAHLSPDFPSFVMRMEKSNVKEVFLLELDKGFCYSHLPKCDSKVTLVDEEERVYVTKYLQNKNSKNTFKLSAKWRRFARDNNLKVDDIVIFQLVEPCTLKAYIIRARSQTELDVAISLLNLNPHIENVKPMDTLGTDQDQARQETTTEKYEKPLLQESCNLKHASPSNAKYESTPDDSDSDFDMGDVDSRIPLHNGRKSYQLRSSRKTFLPRNL